MKNSVRIVLATALLLTFDGMATAAGTYAASEPTWTYQGVVASDSTVSMKHPTVVYDPLGLQGVAGNPQFLMIWGTSTANQLYEKTSDDGRVWGTTGQCSVTFPSATVAIYHPEVIYDRQGFDEKKSTGDVHFKMWFYDAGQVNQNWMRYAESGDGSSWQVFEDSPHVASGGKNFLEFSGGSGNEVAVLYRRGGTGIVVNSTDQEYVGYQAQGNPVGISSDGAWFSTVNGQGGGPTDVVREMVIAGAGDATSYRAWDDFPTAGSVTSWDSVTGLNWSSTVAGNPPISGAAWSDFYGAMSAVVVGDEYYMYDTMKANNNQIGLLTAPIPASGAIPEPSTLVLLVAGGLTGLVVTWIRRGRG